jgi:lipoic acid synthetase
MQPSFSIAPSEQPAGVRPRLPEWLRRALPTSDTFAKTRGLLSELNLNTVCQSAKCPNHWECWAKGTASFMIGGDRCTRACGFCAISTLKPQALDDTEPDRVAEAASRMQLRHVVVTAVARDDLQDGGAAHFARTIQAIRERSPSMIIEVLTPDFLLKTSAIDCVLEAKPHIFNHNMETVRRLTPAVRSRATYDRSLAVLEMVRRRASYRVYTKSGLMLGLGEQEQELMDTMRDLRGVDCDILTLGQYLQPTLKHLPVQEFVSPERFDRYGEQGRVMGFCHVASGPMVRSSYHADAFNANEAEQKNPAG